MSVSRTAAYVAFYRALESDVRDRPPLFQDRFATAFLPPRLNAVLSLVRLPGPFRNWTERYADFRAPGARTSAIARTRFIDDVVRRAAAEGSRQLVILGAGFDCRGHRLSELTGSRIFEMDRPAIQELKRARLRRAGPPAARSDVVYVPVDFAEDDLAPRLMNAGWSAEQPSTFVWEGVSNYLSEPAVAKVLSLVSGAAPRSLIVFTYVHRGVLDGSVAFEGAYKMVGNVRKLGEPWTFGLAPDELASFVARFGLEVEDDTGADDYRRRYAVDWGSGMRGYAFYRIACCRVQARS